MIKEPTAVPKRRMLNIIVRSKKKFCLSLCQSSFVHVRQRYYGYHLHRQRVRTLKSTKGMSALWLVLMNSDSCGVCLFSFDSLSATIFPFAEFAVLLASLSTCTMPGSGWRRLSISLPRNRITFFCKSRQFWTFNQELSLNDNFEKKRKENQTKASLQSITDRSAWTFVHVPWSSFDLIWFDLFYLKKGVSSLGTARAINLATARLS